ncbi:MAG: hypothetical protein ABIT37_14590 [Luteolibacter sp.]
MKTLLSALVMLFCLSRMDAAILNLNGDLTWEVTEPRLTFKMDGGLQNTSPAGTVSGTIKLVLWANKISSPSGYLVGEYTLGQISGGYQFSDFTVSTPSKVPTVTGDYYFTIAVLEYTTVGWQNRLLVNTGTKKLSSGNFVTQLKWPLPTAKILAPLPVLLTGQQVKLTLKGSEFLNLFPADSQKVTNVLIDTPTKATVKHHPGKNAAKYTYKVTTAKYDGKKVQAANLYLDYSNAPDYATVTLFFQGVTSGTYKSVAKIYPAGNPSYTETTWGKFSIK